jgi:hypothetical protein
MLCGMTVGRSFAAVVYLGATLSWAAVMTLGRLLGCEGGNCTTNEMQRMDVSFVLGWVGLTVAAAALLGSLFRRSVGLSVLCLHVFVFAANLGIFWGLGDAPGVFIPLAGLAAAAGYVASVVGLQPVPELEQLRNAVAITAASTPPGTPARCAGHDDFPAFVRHRAALSAATGKARGGETFEGS